MFLYLQIDPSETLDSVTVKDYPAMTSETGSPFSGGSLTSLGSGLWKINIGAVTGNWIVHGLDADDDLLAWGYASDTFDDADGNATVNDYPPWLIPSSSGPTIGANRTGSATIELFTGETPATAVPVVDNDGNAITLTGLTLRLIIEDFTRTDILVVEAGDIDINGSEFTFTPSAAVTATQKLWKWTLLDVGNSLLLKTGLISVNYSPMVDVP